MKKLFDYRANFGLDYSHIQDYTNYIQNIEIIPLKIEDEDYEHYPEAPNAYGVYLRYTTEGIKKANLNPSEWLADFDTEETAQAFKGLIDALLGFIITNQK